MVDKKPTVSVILPTYNRAHLIGRSIQSILNQTYQDFEIIVVDDGSSDNTKEVINSFSDMRIKYVRQQENRGASVARNIGIKLSKGAYIAFQDSDDEWLPDKLKKQMDTFENVSFEVGVIYTDMLQINNKGEKKYWLSPTVTYGNLINPKTLDYQVEGIGIQSALIKKECFDRVEHFDEKFPRFIDLEMFIRLSKYYHFYHIEQPLVKYWTVEGISSNNKALPIARKLLLEKNFGEISKNRNYLAKQYILISRALCQSGRFTEGMNYIVKAFIVTPLTIKILLFSLLIEFAGKCKKFSMTYALEVPKS